MTSNGFDTHAVGRNARVFYGWWIVLVAFICHAVNTGMIFYAWGVFFRPLAEAFGGHAPVASGFSVLQFAAAGYSLLVGRAVDRHGARPVEIVGALVLAVGFLMLSRVHSLAALYLCLAGPVALGSTCIGPLPNNSAVARRFVRRRGRALGIATAGISAGGIVFAPLAERLVSAFGWRAAFAVLGVLEAAIVLPPVMLLMRRDPADLGLLPDGLPAAGHASPADLALAEHEIERSVRPEAAVRQANFWLLAAAFSLTMAGLAAAAFGRLHYGAIAGRMSPLLVLAQGIGVPATGYLRDHTGSYGPVLGTVLAASLLAAGIVLRVRLPGRLQPVAASHTNPR